MPFNGSGGFISLSPPTFPAIPDTTILAVQLNDNLNDVFTGLSNCITRNGQSPPSANLPMGGFKHTGATAAVASGQYLVFGQAASALGVPLALSGNTSSPAFKVTQDGSGPVAVFEESTDSPNPVTITSTGNFLVGALTPIAQSNGNPAEQIVSSNPLALGSTLFGNHTTPTIFELSKSRSATIGGHSVVANGDSLGAIVFSGSDGGNFRQAAYMYSFVDGTPGSGVMPGAIAFTTTPAGTATPVLRFHIRADGSARLADTTSTGPFSFSVSRNITGAAGYHGVLSDGVIQPDVTTNSALFQSYINLAAGTVINDVFGYASSVGSVAGGSVQNAYGFQAHVSLAVGVVNSYGYYSDLNNTGASVWASYFAGTAPSYFGGQACFGTTVHQGGTGDTPIITKASASTAFSLTSVGRAGDDAGVIRFVNAAFSAETARINASPDLLIINTGSGAGERVRFSGGGSQFTGSVGIDFTPSASVPLLVQATSSAALGIGIVGRASDNTSILNFYNSSTSTEFGRIQLNSSGMILATGASATARLTLDATTATFSSNVSMTGNTLFINPTAGNGGIELGRQGASNTPFIDFHSGATNVDYDSRIIAGGGNGVVQNGTLTYLALSHSFSGDVVINSINMNTDKNHSTDGHQRLPGGFIIQWGRISCTEDSSATESFSMTFPNNVFSVVCTVERNNADGADNTYAAHVLTWTTSQVTVGVTSSHLAIGTVPVHYVAFGN